MPGTVQITSNITDVAAVHYYLNGNLVSGSWIPPFGSTVTNVLEGGYSLRVEAVSSGGLTSGSCPVTVSFSSPESASIGISVSGGTIILSWPVGWSLESAPKVTGPWTFVLESSNPYTVTTTADQMFYRLVH